MKKRGKKAQVTAFMIIGIIILIVGGVTFYLISGEDADREAELLKIAAKQPFIVQPVQKFVEDCIRTTTETAIKQMQTGGYIDATDIELSGTTINVDETEPTNADAITLFEEQIIPYWHYMKSSNRCIENCEFDTKKPNLHKTDGEPSIEGQIDRYIQKELDACINNLEVFENLELKDSGKIRADTLVRENDVTILVDYSIKIEEQDGTSYSLDKFYTTVNFDFQKVYDMADAIIDYEINNSYMERATMNWIAGFSGLEFNKFPPLFASDYGCESNIFWIEEDVHYNKLNPMLSTYVQSFQPIGIENQIDFEGMNEMQRGLYSQSLILTNSTLAEGLEVTHSYLEWPTYMLIHTSKGGLLEPEVTSMSMLGLYDYCNAEYKFAYDVSYPAMVQITDPDAFNGEGYTLSFAIEANIRRNEPAYNSDLQELAAQMPTYVEESMLCKRNQRTSGDITIETFDARSNQPLDDVMVRYCVQDADGGCGDDVCFMGVTKGGKLVTQLPPGQGLLLLSKKPEYKEVGAIFGSAQGEKGELKASLEPLRKVNVSLTKRILKKSCDTVINTTIAKEIGGLFTGGISKIARLIHGDYFNEVCWWDFDKDDQRELAEKETAMVFFKRMDPSYRTFSAQAVLTADEPSQEIELIPGKYKVEVMVISDEKVIIPEDDFCYDEGFLDMIGIGVQECVTRDRIEMNGTILGGVSINKETGGYLYISPQDLNKKEMVIYSVSPEILNITKHDDLKLMGLTANYTKELREYLLPEFK